MRLWEKTQKIYKKNREIERERLPVGGWSDEVALWNKEAEQRGEREREDSWLGELTRLQGRI